MKELVALAKSKPGTLNYASAGVPGYEASNWWGVLAPAGTPPAIARRLHGEIAVILAKPDIQKKFETQGAEALSMGQAEFGKFIRTETAKWGRVVREAGIKA